MRSQSHDVNIGGAPDTLSATARNIDAVVRVALLVAAGHTAAAVTPLGLGW